MKQIVTKVKKKTTDGYTNAIPVGAKAQNVILNNGTVLQDVIDVLSTGQAGHRDLTQAQYNALTEQEKYNGTVYFVQDGASNGTITNASVIGYNDTNVQSALDNISINKINYSDVVNNLTSNSTSLPLSAAQGKELKDQIDSQDTRITALENQNTGEYIYTTIMGKQATIYKYGRIVEISFNINYASEIPTIPSRVTTNVGTIPAGYRPANTCVFPIYHSQYTNVILQCSISPAGAVEIYNFSETQFTGSWIRFRTVYFSE